MSDELLPLKVDEVITLFTSSYTIPIEYREIVKKAINRYAQPNKCSEEKLTEMVNKAMSPLDTFKYLTTNKNFNLNQWKGHLAEWIVCYEYNSRRNNGNVVFTFVNPDSSSKADILHIIKKGNNLECIAGPDIKTGQPSYLLNQLEKVWAHEGNIPFFDYYGVLRDEKKLTNKQREKLRNLKEKYPRKKILIPSVSRLEVIRFSDKYLRRIAGQQRGPTSSAIKKAKANALTTTKTERSWTALNHNTLLQEAKRAMLLKELKLLEIKQSKLIEDMVKRNEERNRELIEASPKNKILKGMSSLKEWAINTPVAKFIQENGEEILTNIIISITQSVDKQRESTYYDDDEDDDYDYDKRAGKETNIDNYAIQQGEEDLEDQIMRSSPTEHEVRGYYRQDGTYVNSYTRGKN
ncbi:hypothetical protein FC678_18760 [Peribacillus simplex]|uniref:Uncharacterized protein n=1 Tax=Peribacillus simplex TaxID=1478 RepID=A0A9X8ZF41_9BACI|nr:hypothetical protein [Peribacillus simplex]TKH08956.1 hypothetical protein FC678_18760 [Peribacillus simplex]